MAEAEVEVEEGLRRALWVWEWSNERMRWPVARIVGWTGLPARLCVDAMLAIGVVMASAASVVDSGHGSCCCC